MNWKGHVTITENKMFNSQDHGELEIGGHDAEIGVTDRNGGSGSKISTTSGVAAAERRHR